MLNLPIAKIKYVVNKVNRERLSGDIKISVRTHRGVMPRMSVRLADGNRTLINLRSNPRHDIFFDMVKLEQVLNAMVDFNDTPWEIHMPMDGVELHKVTL